MTNKKFEKLFGGPPRKPEKKTYPARDGHSRIYTEGNRDNYVEDWGNMFTRRQGRKTCCMAGGVALNCVGNGILLREGPFEDIWIQPSAGDAGAALGAALAIWHHYLDMPRESNGKEDKQSGSYLGPHFSNEKIKKYLDENNYPYTECMGDGLYDDVSKRLENGDIIGWFQGRMEFGPRALGARSIIG